MTNKLNEALKNVEMTYSQVVEIADTIIAKYFTNLNNLVSTINSRINALTIDQIREYMMELQLQAFSLSEIKEKSTLKAELAVAIQKEKFAISFTGADGTAAAKDKIALIATNEEAISEALYNLVANLFKTKLDQTHRLVDVLKSILMSRMQEAKFMNVGVDNNIPITKQMNLTEDYGKQL